MMAIWYRLKYWLVYKRNVRKTMKARKAADPWIYEERDK